MNANLTNANNQLQEAINSIGQENEASSYIVDALQGYSIGLNSVSNTVSSFVSSGSQSVMDGGIGVMMIGVGLFATLAVYNLFFRDPFAR